MLIPRYLVNNKITLVANGEGFVTEYRPVYQKQIEVFKGIDNTIEFRVINADQKPLNIQNFTPKFMAFDENDKLVIEHDGIVLDDSSDTRGKFKVIITENDLLNIPAQFLTYNTFLVDSDNAKTLTYAYPHFDANGILKLSKDAFPSPAASASVTTFTETSDDVWTTEGINAEPAINGNEALHTAAFYTNNYVGDVVIQATLDNQLTSTNNWADIATVTLDGTETDPVPQNYTGVFSYVRFKTTSDPANKITKILVRN
tara:strand:- start:211 stop:984 length:774 start_codon:yes stop_codon:yes gene_type:complete